MSFRIDQVGSHFMVWSSNCWFGALTINVTGNGSISFAQTAFLYFFGRKNWWIFDQIRFQTMNFSIFLSVVCVSRAKNQFYNVFFFPSLTKLIHIRLLDILKCNEKKNFWIFYSYFDSFQFSSIKVDNRREKKTPIKYTLISPFVLLLWANRTRRLSTNSIR